MSSLYDRIAVAAQHLNVLLRGASMGGPPVSVDIVEREDRVTGTPYTEVVVNPGCPDDSPGKSVQPPTQE